jgi:hypothetical protein
LEELVPEEEENTGLEDRPDPAAGEASASKRRCRRRRWRERGRGGGRTAKVASSLRAPLFIWTSRRTGLSGPNLDRIFRHPDNPAQKWPG